MQKPDLRGKGIEHRAFEVQPCDDSGFLKGGPTIVWIPAPFSPVDAAQEWATSFTLDCDITTLTANLGMRAVVDSAAEVGIITTAGATYRRYVVTVRKTARHKTQYRILLRMRDVSDKWITGGACGSWAVNVPQGFVGVDCRIGKHYLDWDGRQDEQLFRLIPKEEYHNVSRVIDPAKYEPWIRIPSRFGDGYLHADSSVPAHLEYLREKLRFGTISQGEILDLQNLASYIDPGDTELLEAAGVPE